VCAFWYKRGPRPFIDAVRLFAWGESIAMHCSTNALKLMCFFFGCAPASSLSGVVDVRRADDVPAMVSSCAGGSSSAGVASAEAEALGAGGGTRGGESLRNAWWFFRQRMMCESLFVCISGGRAGKPCASAGPSLGAAWSSSSSSSSSSS
jgi:hypothetical protein